MKLCIDGVDTALETISFSEKAYGHRHGQKVVPFSLEVAHADFMRKLQPLYETCIAELRRDDVQTGTFTPPYEGATDYPTLERLFELSSKRRMEFIDSFLILDILRLYVEEERSAGVKWFIQRCESLDRNGEACVLKGYVRQA
jgi:hypothetical protein